MYLDELGVHVDGWYYQMLFHLEIIFYNSWEKANSNQHSAVDELCCWTNSSVWIILILSLFVDFVNFLRNSNIAKQIE